jgi:hypothetical protein
MRRFLTLMLVVTAAVGHAASGRAEDSALADGPLPAGPPVDVEPAEGVTEPSPPPLTESLPPSVSADGTTSVVVPAAEPDVTPPAEPPAALPPAPPFNSLPTLPPSPPTTPPAATAAVAPPQQPPQVPASDAATVLAALLEPLPGPPGGPLPSAYARPLPLIESLIRSGDRSRRLWIVQAYWKVATGYASVRCTTAAVERLELVAPGGDPHDRATLDVATAAARADLADANARLFAAQQELVDLARLSLGEPPPWPIDRPLADPYQTRFDEIFANRIATGRVRAIVRTLPARHEALSARATAVTAADHAMRMAEADHAKGNRPIEAVITAHAALIDQEQAFLDAVRSYNLEIAEYAMAVADLSLSDEQFVSMLIASPTAWQPQQTEGAVFGPTTGSLQPVVVPALPDSLPPTATVIQID